MEGVYMKLYDKYDKLKNTRFSEFEQYGHDQAEKFADYVSRAEEMIELLRNENERLQTRLDELNEEVHSIRSSSDEYQKLLTEACEKTKELSKEVERFQNLHQEAFCRTSMEGVTDNVRIRKRSIDHVHLGSSGGTQVGSEDTSIGSLRKKPRLQHAVAAQPYEANQLNLTMATDSEKDSRGASLSNDDQGLQQANDYIWKLASSGDCMSADFMLQSLMESLVGLKFAFVNEAERLCISSVHQSSGYSFSLTWVSNAAEEAELLYQVLSLGTIGRVATDWMKGDIMFSLSMFPVFLKRISKVLGLQL